MFMQGLAGLLTIGFLSANVSAEVECEYNESFHAGTLYCNGETYRVYQDRFSTTIYGEHDDSYIFYRDDYDSSYNYDSFEIEENE